MLQSRFYKGMVSHRRLRPKEHRLAYAMTSMLVDIDELPQLDHQSRLFAWNRFAPVSFYDKDHGPRDGSPLRPWIEQQLQAAGIDLEGGRISLLCYPRLFGYVFNPLSIWYCYHQDGSPRTIMYAVNNTWHEQHCYLIPVDADGNPDHAGMLRHSCDKDFFVSPFMPMEARYDFAISQPGKRCKIGIRLHQNNDTLLTATFTGHRQAFDRATLWRLAAGTPFMTLKVMAGIHWEALKIWLKGMKIFDHPDKPQDTVSIHPQSLSAKTE